MKRVSLTILIIGIVFSGGWWVKAQDGGRPVITPENVAQLTVLQRLGRGSFEYVDWSPDGEYLVIAGSMGLWLFDAHDLEDEPRLLEAYGAKQSLTFSPDDQWVALSMYDVGKSVVRLWNLANGQQGPVMEGGDARFSPNSRLLASRTGNTILLWDVATGEKIHILEGHTAYPKGLAFSPDSTLLASSSWDGSARLWDVSTGEVLFEWDDHGTNGTAGVPAVTFTPDGTQLITAGEDGTVRWWDVVTGENLRIVEGPFRPADLKFSPDGTLLALASIGQGLWLWDETTGDQLYVLEDYASWFVTFSPDGTQLASTVTLWDVATGNSLRLLEGSDDRLNWAWSFNGLRFSSDGTQVAEIGNDGAVWVWDVNTGKRLMTLQGTYSTITGGAFSPDSSLLVSSSLNDNSVRVWDVTTGENVHDFYPSHPILTAAFSPDGSFIAAGNAGYGVHLLDPVTGQENRLFQGQPLDSRHAVPGVSSLIFSPDGALLAFGGYDAATKVWDVASGQELYVLGSWVIPVSDLAFSSDSRLLARASSVGGPTVLWDMSTGEEVCTLLGDADYRTASSVVFNLDGTLLVEASNDGVLLWNVETCQQVRVLQGHTNQVTGLALSPDGRLLASGSWDDTVRLWDITTGEQLHVLGSSNPAAGMNLNAGHLAFSPDGTVLAVGLTGGEIWLWGIPKE